jgi:hypothetical protein
MSFGSRARYIVCLVVCLAALAFAALGCGGKSGTQRLSGKEAAKTAKGSTSAARAGSTQRFIAQAETLCARANAEIAAIKAHGASAAEVVRVVPRTLAIERRGIGELERLRPPDSLAGSWRKMLGYRRTLAAQLAQLLEIAKNNDGTSIKALASSKKRTHAGLSRVSTDAGFKDCAKVGRVG